MTRDANYRVVLSWKSLRGDCTPLAVQIRDTSKKSHIFFLNHNEPGVKVPFERGGYSPENEHLTPSSFQELTKLCPFESVIVDGRQNCFSWSCKSGTTVQEHQNSRNQSCHECAGTKNYFYVSYDKFWDGERQLYVSFPPYTRKKLLSHRLNIFFKILKELEWI